MKGGNIVLNVIKISLVVGGASLIIKMILGWYYGYKNLDATYGASAYYHWRVNYVDSKVSKMFYSPIPLNDQAHDDIFFKYIDRVQGKTKQYAKSYDFKTKKYELIEGKRLFPFYAYGFTDAFVYPPNKNWMLFKNSSEYLDLEFKYLELRGKFITSAYKFTDKDFEKYYSKENNGAFLRKGSHFTPVKTDVVVDFFKQHNDFIDPIKVCKIIYKIISKEKDYNIILNKDSAIMSSNLEADVMDLVESVFAPLKITKDQVNDFFYRLAIISPLPTDGHILNRIYTYCRMLFVGIDFDNTNIKPYNDLKNQLNEVTKEIKSNTNISEDLRERKLRKQKNLKKKISVLLSEIIFVKVSQLFASLYGKGDFILDNADDNRSILKKIGSVSLSFKSDYKKEKDAWKGDENLLKNNIIALLEKFYVPVNASSN